MKSMIAALQLKSLPYSAYRNIDSEHKNLGFNILQNILSKLLCTVSRLIQEQAGKIHKAVATGNASSIAQLLLSCCASGDLLWLLRRFAILQRW